METTCALSQLLSVRGVFCWNSRSFRFSWRLPRFIKRLLSRNFQRLSKRFPLGSLGLLNGFPLPCFWSLSARFYRVGAYRWQIWEIWTLFFNHGFPWGVGIILKNVTSLPHAQFGISLWLKIGLFLFAASIIQSEYMLSNGIVGAVVQCLFSCRHVIISWSAKTILVLCLDFYGVSVCLTLCFHVWSLYFGVGV